MAELAFEVLALALESTAGTAVAAPTSFFNLSGTVSPRKEYFEPDDASGLLAAVTRSKVVRKWSEWSADGGLDTDVLPVLLEMFVKGGVSPTQPGTAASAYQWDYTPTMNADDLKTATIWFGDPNLSDILQAAYGIPGSLTISNDASTTDGASLSLAGMANFPSKVSAPTLPARAFVEGIAGLDMQVYLDTASPIGTTEVAGRVVSAEHSLEAAVQPKYIATGPGGSKTFTRTGRGKRRMVTRVTMELIDYTEYDVFASDDTVARLRVIHNGGFIENDGTDDYYHAVQVDTYGQLRFADWGDLEGTNRTVTFEVQSQYDATAGADWAIQVTNELSALPS